MQHHIIYLAHSNRGYVDECRFSLLKYLSVYKLTPPAHIAMVIYTDQPQMFEAFIPFFHQFEIIEITQQQIKDWQGKYNYVYRVKPEVIKDFFASHTGSLLFFDTDTYITHPIDDLVARVTDGTVYMYHCEGAISSSKFEKWNNFLRKNTIIYGEKKFEYTPELQLWNSGILAINETYAPLINEVLLLIDSIYKDFPKHIAEQVACSYVFQKLTTIHPADDLIVHYWNVKEFRDLLQAFFRKNEEESIPNQVKGVQHINVATIQQHKQRYEQLPFYKKWLLALMGKNWTIKQYEHKL